MKDQIAVLDNARLKMQDRKTQEQNFMIKTKDQNTHDWKMHDP